MKMAVILVVELMALDPNSENFTLVIIVLAT